MILMTCGPRDILDWQISNFFETMMGAFQRDGIFRVHILEHFLPISKQTLNPSASTECEYVVCFKKSKFSQSLIGLA